MATTFAESGIYEVEREHPDWTCLASLDNSEPYATDLHEIWVDAEEGVHYVSASGCSCWGGEYDEQGYATLTDLHMDLMKNDPQGGYSPTFTGLDILMQEALSSMDRWREERRAEKVKRMFERKVSEERGDISMASDEDIRAAELLLGKGLVH